MSASFQIDADFPGGNIVVESVDGDEVRLHQELRDTIGDWFYWCFRIRGCGGRVLHFRFTRSRALGVRGPAISLDAGKTWSWLGSESLDGNGFRCEIPSEEAYFSFGMPYQESHWQAFLAGLGHHSRLQLAPLCQSEKGREVDSLWLRCDSGAPACRVVITCRHHSCEMMASYTLEGLIRWLLEDEEAAWFRQHAELWAIPFVDKDGVEEGDQGKNRRPHDHGREYASECIYASTKAIRQQAPVWGDGRLRVGLDLHCPYISGPQNEHIYQVGSPDESIAEEQRRFSTLLESVATGPLPYTTSDFLPYGEGWNKADNYKDKAPFSHWFGRVPGVTLASTIEIPYANARGVEVNQESARRFGVDLGKALVRYLRENAD